MKKLIGLMKSRTHWAGLALAMLVGGQAQLMSWLQIKLSAEDYALAGLIVYVAVTALRWVTTKPLDEK